jgi:hypothetical protein
MNNSPLEQPHNNLRLRQRIEKQVETDNRRRCIGQLSTV